MEEPKKVFVSIYCKIYTDCFSLNMFNRMATGQEIYDFLMRDAGLCEERITGMKRFPETAISGIWDVMRNSDA